MKKRTAFSEILIIAGIGLALVALIIPVYHQLIFAGMFIGLGLWLPKKVLPVLIFFIITSVSAQTVPQYVLNENEFTTYFYKGKCPATFTDSLKYELQYKNYCLEMRQDCIFGGILYTGLSGVFFCITAKCIEQNKNLPAAIFSAFAFGSSVCGLYLFTEAHGWLKSARLQPTLYGATLTLNFP